MSSSSKLIAIDKFLRFRKNPVELLTVQTVSPV